MWATSLSAEHRRLSSGSPTVPTPVAEHGWNRCGLLSDAVFIMVFSILWPDNDERG